MALLGRRLTEQTGERAVVWVQNPVQLGPDTEPQPDLALLRPRPDHYRDGLPDAGDVLLIVEVADASLLYDRDVKIPLYARSGIPEVWLIDLEERTLSRYEQPRAGKYRVLEGPLAHGTVAPRSLDAAAVDVDELLGS